MGDRITVIVKHEDAAVVLYSHSLGSDMKGIIAKALHSDAGRNRRQDYNYLTRIIFSAMVKGYEADECGCGISALGLDEIEGFVDECAGADNHPAIVINMVKQTVDGIDYRDFIAKELK